MLPLTIVGAVFEKKQNNTADPTPDDLQASVSENQMKRFLYRKIFTRGN